jgi:hypothetical protein
MAEEAENSGGGSLKSILIGLASTIALGIGGYVTKTLTDEKDEPAAAVSAPAPVINITTNNTQQQKNVVGGGGGAAAAAKPASAPKPKPKTAKEELEEAPKW